MAVDGLHATRPVEFPVGRPEEAQGMFDVLTYQKGGSVLRMLEQFLGPDVFREGINDYLDHPQPRQHRDLRPVGRPRSDPAGGPCAPSWTPGSTRAGTRWCGWATTAPSPRPRSPTGGKPGGAIGSAWLVPVLTRSLDEHRGRLPAHPAGRDPRPRADPVTIRSGTDLVNAGGSGYYRVAYPTAMVERLAGRLGRARACSSATTWSRDTWAASLSARLRSPTSSSWPAPWSTRPRATRASGPWSSAPSGCSTGWSPDADRPGPGPVASATLLGPLARDLGWDPRDDDGERTPSLRASVLRTLGHHRRGPGGPGRGRPTLRRRPARVARTPTSSRPSWTSWPAHGGDTRVRGRSWPATGARPTPRRRTATSTPWPRSPSPTWPCGPSIWP